MNRTQCLDALMNATAESLLYSATERKYRLRADYDKVLATYESALQNIVAVRSVAI